MANSFNQVTLMGRFTKDPEVRATSSGKKVVNFTLAVDKYNEGVNFIECEAWGNQAEFIEKYIKKGNLALVGGELNQQTWEQDGQKRSKLNVVVRNIQGLTRNEKTESSEENYMPSDKELETIDISEIPF